LLSYTYVNTLNNSFIERINYKIEKFRHIIRLYDVDFITQHARNSFDRLLE